MINVSKFAHYCTAFMVPLMVLISGCKTTQSPRNSSATKSIWIPNGGLMNKQGFLIFGSEDGQAVCYASMKGKNGEVLASADLASFKSTLSQMFDPSNQDQDAGSKVEDFYQRFIASKTRIDATSISDPVAQTMTNMSYQAARQATAPHNPNSCVPSNSGSSNANADVQKASNPGYLFVLLSYGRSWRPGQAHTFGFFAKMDPNSRDRIVEHVPFSWLPVATNPRDEVNGRPILDSDGRLVMADVMSAFSRPRLGWNFSVSQTIDVRAQTLGKRDFEVNGAFVVSADQYQRAQVFHDVLNRNTIAAAGGNSPDPDGYLYQANNVDLFRCPNGGLPSDLNCFQAIIGSFGTCLTSGPMSGVAVTEFLRGKLQGKGLLGDFYYRDPAQIAPLLDQVRALEADGRFDSPGVN